MFLFSRGNTSSLLYIYTYIFIDRALSSIHPCQLVTPFCQLVNQQKEIFQTA
jgi:hypothetical protein